VSPRRAPSAPPAIADFTFVELLGSGGYSDVFLYEQSRPRRQVAVKVLLQDIANSGARQRFEDEANLMAKLSAHPSIVTIYGADVANDGRPFLVMEYCPRDNLDKRCRQSPLSVPDALTAAIQVAGAVETAHRAGILHRDIKPANVLVTVYNRPALTDFGISAATTGGASELEGLSVPWSPPESFDGGTAGPPSDVYSLAATVYALLTGRSPFEVRGGPNGTDQLMDRIERLPLPRTGRADVPDSLERALATAMAKDPTRRYGTALEFARVLQGVQRELRLSVTPIDVVDESAPPPERQADDDGLTRIRSPRSVDPAPPPALGALSEAPMTSARAEAAETAAPTRAAEAPRASSAWEAPRPVPVADTVHRAPERAAPAEDAPDREESGGRRRLWASLAAASVLVAVVTTVVLVGQQGEGQDAPEDTASTAAPLDPAGVGGPTVPVPADLAGQPSGEQVVFTWTNPEPVDGDVFLWRLAGAASPSSFQDVEAPTVTVPANPDGETCIEVVVRRSNGRHSDPATTCTQR
jgi:serine/threonine protein kinase